MLPSPAAKPRTLARGAVVTRTGVQSAGDPFEFVMASDDVDRMGDVIDITGIDLAAFKSNPIALWGHDSTSPIGTWESVRKIGGQLTGKLKLAAEGTSPLIDRLRKLIEQRILRAVSVGFRAIDFVERDKKSFGLRYTKTELLECSLVAVPANAAALRLKGISPDPLDTQIFRDLSRTPAPPPRVPSGKARSPARQRWPLPTPGTGS